MKKILTVCMTAFVLCSCKNEQVNSFSGFITDASMNVVTVKALTGDETRVFTIENADKSQANGLLLGNLITVEYKGELSDTTPAVKVATDATYADAVGTWTMPDPINPDGKMGVELQVEGKAASINMATLPVDSWELQGEAGKIILKGRSIGNGTESEYSRIATIEKKDGRMYLRLDGTEVVYEKN